ncbi:MAG: TIR domain-containing protein [Anaerolineae bacterium]|nr:TIR domain-containing protein [Anaerolineae bacterium]
MKIFISYARANKEVVLEILQPMKSHEIWFDDRLNIGQDWWVEIQHEIAACHCFMLLISPQSLISEYCQKELEYARKLNKPIAPVLIAPTGIPEDLQKLQIIDLSAGLIPATTVALLNGLFEIERLVFNPLRASGSQQSPTTRRLSISDLYFVSRSQTKRVIYEQILGATLQFMPIEIDEIQRVDPTEIALRKVQEAFQMMNKPVFVEQTALAVRAWGGLPGGMTNAFITTMGLGNFCRAINAFDDHYAEAISVIAFSDGNMKRTFAGSLPGEIATRPRGDGYRWNPIFTPQGFDQTFGEMREEEILSISMRRRAIVDFMRFLQSNYMLE